ncbi:MAG: hypothetical protein HGA27_02085 [Peptococcaceae bacterium]|nr:hypothetical protein [Peptococcaceae bacterium]
MNFLEKLKAINKKWLYLLIGAIVAGLLIMITGAILHWKFEKEFVQLNPVKTSSVYRDLILLENTGNLRISSEQAKAILPLVEKMSNAEDEVKTDLSNQVYSQLNPQQIQLLLNKGDNFRQDRKEVSPRGEDEFSKREFEKPRLRENNDILVQSLPEVTIKMLKEKLVAVPQNAEVTGEKIIQIIPKS